MTKPRYLVNVYVPRYDNRDVIVGSRAYLIGTAETAGWAYHLCDRANNAEDMQYGDAFAQVVDSRTGRLVPRPCNVPSLEEQYAADIPF